VLAAVYRTFAEIETNDAVVARESIVGELVEHPGCGPCVASVAQCRVRHAVAQQTFGIDPRAAGHESDQDALEAHPVRDSWPMTTEQVRIDRGGGQQRFNRCPHSIYHLGIQRAHDDRCLHSVVVG
jgi:hypothetical protein